MSGGCAARVALWAENPEDFDDVGKMLAGRGLCVFSTDSEERLRSWVLEGQVHLVITELSMTFRAPLDFLHWLKTQSSPPPVLVVAEGMHVPLYLEAMRRGAFDCVGQPLHENEVMRMVARALEASPALASARGEQ
jgi:DNA-binding NtrC family response regulator